MTSAIRSSANFETITSFIVLFCLMFEPRQ